MSSDDNSASYANGVVTVIDKPITFNVKKTDLNGKDVDGAKLKVTYQEDGATVTVDEWTSDSATEPNGHAIGSKLQTGVTYTMTEVSAPNGFLVRTDFTFMVNVDGTVTVTDSSTTGQATYADGVLTVKDEDFTVLVNKIDASTDPGTELENAVLALYESDGTTAVMENGKAATWTSKKGETWDISGLVAAGGTYVLKETTTPDDYITVDPVTFKVKADGSLTLITVDKDGNSKETDYTDDASITGTYSDGINVVNRKAPSTTGYFWVKKNITHTATLPEGVTFTFTLTGSTGAPMPEKTSITLPTDKNDWSDTFGDITFTEVGTYTYTVKETKPQYPSDEENSFIYDTTEHTVVFKVTLDGKTMSHSMSIDGSASGNILTITNTYAPVKVLKVDENGNAKSGAYMQLLNENKQDMSASGKLSVNWCTS